jgi:hypothetical protein
VVTLSSPPPSPPAVELRNSLDPRPPCWPPPPSHPISMDADGLQDMFVNDWDGGSVVYLHNDWNGHNYRFSPELLVVAEAFAGSFSCQMVGAQDMDMDGGT